MSIYLFELWTIADYCVSLLQLNKMLKIDSMLKKITLLQYLWV